MCSGVRIKITLIMGVGALPTRQVFEQFKDGLIPSLKREKFNAGPLLERLINDLKSEAALLPNVVGSTLIAVTLLDQRNNSNRILSSFHVVAHATGLRPG